MLTVTKEFEFDAAHVLPNYNGPCGNLHGHRWKLQVTVSGEVNKETGMILDFKYLKGIVENRVVKILDHSSINDTLDMPTAELMVLHIVKVLQGSMFTELGVMLEKVRLYETPTSYCEWSNK